MARDLGSFRLILKTGFNQQHYEGKSVDVDKVKAIVDVEQGSTISCVDNGDYYKFLEATQEWVLQQ